jgi:hypothetical protein
MKPLLPFRGSRPGHFSRLCGRGKAPPPCSRLRQARGSPTRRGGSGSGLPPVTAEEVSLSSNASFPWQGEGRRPGFAGCRERLPLPRQYPSGHKELRKEIPVFILTVFAPE